MNMLDLVVLFLLAVGLFRGAWVGGRTQLVSAASWGVGLVSAWFGAGPLAQSVEGALAVPYAASWVVSAIIVAGVAGFVTRFVAEFALGEAKAKVSAVDRALGALWGGAKWGLVLWLGLSTVTLFDGPLRRFKVPVEDSTAYRLGHDRNVWRMAFGRRIERLEQALRKLGPGAAEVSGDAVVDEVRTDPRFVALGRGGLREALAGGDLSKLLHSDEAMSLLSDGDFLEKVEAIVAPSTGE